MKCHFLTPNRLPAHATTRRLRRSTRGLSRCSTRISTKSTGRWIPTTTTTRYFNIWRTTRIQLNNSHFSFLNLYRHSWGQSGCWTHVQFCGHRSFRQNYSKRATIRLTKWKRAKLLWSMLPTFNLYVWNFSLLKCYYISNRKFQFQQCSTPKTKVRWTFINSPNCSSTLINGWAFSKPMIATIPDLSTIKN